jgi:hypothetical protein
MARRAALAVLFTVATLATASADPTSEAMLRDFVGGIDASADWSASMTNVRSDGAETIGEGLVFTRSQPHVSMSIEEIRLRDLVANADGGFSASNIDVKGAAAVGDKMEYSIPSISVKGVKVPSVEGVDLDPRHMMTSLARLYSLLVKTELGEINIPEISGSQRQTTPEAAVSVTARVVYRNMTMNGLKDGLIEHTGAGPFSMETDGPDGRVQFEAQSVLAERTDLGAIAHIMDPAQYQGGRGDGVWRPVLGKIVYSGFSGGGPEGATFRLNEVSIENIDGRQPEEPFTDLWDEMLDPNVSDSARSDLALEAVLKMYSAWRLGTIRVGGLAVEAPAESASFSLESLTVSGLSNVGMDSLLVKNVAAKGPGGFGSFDTFEIAGFVFPDLRALMNFAALENKASQKKHEETVRATFAALPRLAHLGLSGLRAGESEAEAVSLSSLTIDLSNWNDIFAESVEVRVTDLEIPRSLAEVDAKSSAVLDQLGYERLVYGMSLSDRWSPDAGTDNATWTLSMKDAADLQLTYSLTGVTTDWILRATAAAGKATDTDAALNEMYKELGLKAASLKITDRSLLDRGFAVAAKMQNLTIEGAAYREQLRGALPFLLSAAVPQDLTKLLSEPLQSFMAGGQTLVAEIAPPAPIPLHEVIAAAEDPMSLPSRLGITLRSEAPAQ